MIHLVRLCRFPGVERHYSIMKMVWVAYPFESNCCRLSVNDKSQSLNATNFLSGFDNHLWVATAFSFNSRYFFARTRATWVCKSGLKKFPFQEKLPSKNLARVCASADYGYCGLRSINYFPLSHRPTAQWRPGHCMKARTCSKAFSPKGYAILCWNQKCGADTRKSEKT